EEADARNNVGRYSTLTAVSGDQSAHHDEHGSANRHQSVRSQPGHALSPLAFQSDRCAQSAAKIRIPKSIQFTVFLLFRDIRCGHRTPEERGGTAMQSTPPIRDRSQLNCWKSSGCLFWAGILLSQVAGGDSRVTN